jgi:serine/threonine protein kinase
MLDERLGLKELFILRKINHKNIARLYECIIDEDLDKIVLVMENCDLGQLMKYNDESTGYDYNPSLIKFLLSQFFIENIGNQREYIISLLRYKENNELNETINEIISDLTTIDTKGKKIEEISSHVVDVLFDLFEKNIKLRIFFTKIIFKQIIHGIKYLHAKNICNRDIKPENIVFKNTFSEIKLNESMNLIKNNEKKIPDNFVKLIDFSISKIYKNKNQKIFSTCGSDLFKSPEMLNLEYFNPFKAEIYSLGVTMIYFIFKKFYKPNSIKNFQEEEKLTIIEELNNDTTINKKSQFNRESSKLMIMKSNSLLLRARKSSMIYVNYENLEKKDFIGHIDELKGYFETCDEMFLYDLLKKMVHENADERIDIDEIENNIFFL